MRRDSFASYNGSYGIGDVTRTPCDASIDIEEQRDDLEDRPAYQQNTTSKKEGGCCKSKKNQDFMKTSEYEDHSQHLEYQRPPTYFSEESSSNNEDRSDGDSGVSNSKYAVANNDKDELGVMMSSFHGNEKLVTTAL